MIFCSRCVLLVPTDVRSCSTFIHINVKASDVVGVRGISSTGELTGALRAASALGIVSIPVEGCLIPRSTRSGSKGNKPALRYADLMFSGVKAVVRARSYRRVKCCFLTVFAPP
jgi:hypothetical protein